MSNGLFDVRPLIEEHDSKIATLERDVVVMTQVQTEFKIDVVEAGEKNRNLIVNAIEINRKLLTGISEDIQRDIRRMNTLIDIKLATLATIAVVGFLSVICLLNG